MESHLTDAKCPRRLKVDDKLEPGQLLDRKSTKNPPQLQKSAQHKDFSHFPGPEIGFRGHIWGHTTRVTRLPPKVADYALDRSHRPTLPCLDRRRAAGRPGRVAGPGRATACAAGFRLPSQAAIAGQTAKGSEMPMASP
jgi:hypothetical protein